MDFNWTVHFWRPKIQMRRQNAFGLHNTIVSTIEYLLMSLCESVIFERNTFLNVEKLYATAYFLNLLHSYTMIQAEMILLKSEKMWKA